MPDVESGEWLNHSDPKELRKLAHAIRDVRIAMELLEKASAQCATACTVAHKPDQAAFWQNLANQLEAAMHDASLKWNEDKCLEAIGYHE